jgi:hypothetical protein
MNAPLNPGHAIAERDKGLLPARGESGRPIVVVLGMHRSGTSLCSHILSMLGVDMADELLTNSGNEKGHWERLEIMAFQDEILTLLDRGYWTPQHDFPLPGAWWAEPKVRAVQARIESFLTERMKGANLFGFKDPRTARLLPMWLQIFANMNLAPKFILCLRAPSQIARSLKQRDGLDPIVGEYRSLNYLTDCFRYIPRHDLCLIEYEQWFENYSDNLNGLMNFLNIEWSQSEADLGAAVAAIVDRDLRHTEERLGTARQPLVRSFFNLATGLRKDPSRRGEIDHFVNQFVAFQQLLQPFERAQRELSGVAARVPGLEGRIAELEAANASGQDREHALNEGLAEHWRALESARAELQAAQARLGALSGVAGQVGERDAKIAELAATIEANDAAARQREQALNESVAAVQNHYQELSAIAAQLPERDAKIAEFAATLEASEARSAQREQALSENLVARDNDLEAVREALRTTEIRLQESSEIASYLPERDAKIAELAAASETMESASRLRDQALTDRNSALEAALSEALRRSSAVEASLAASTSNAIARQRENEATVRELSETRTERDALDQQLGERFRELGVHVARADALGSRLIAVSSDLDAAKRQAAANSAAMERESAERRALKARVIDAEAAQSAATILTKSGGFFGFGNFIAQKQRSIAKRLVAAGLIETEYYRSQFPQDFLDGAVTPLAVALHYVRIGFCKGGLPNALFGSRWYLERYEDVRCVGINPLLHYHLHGWREGRDPGPKFETEYYLSASADVRLSGMDPLTHYLLHGRTEGRRRKSDHRAA